MDELRRNARELPLDEILALPTTARGSELGEQEVGIAFFQALSGLERRCQFLIESFYVNNSSYNAGTEDSIPLQGPLKALYVPPFVPEQTQTGQRLPQLMQPQR
jgi:hypothetical protein